MYVFLDKTATKALNFTPKWGWFGRMFLDWGRNPPMIPIPEFTNLLKELVLTLEAYNIVLQPHIHGFWADTTKQILDFLQYGDLLGRKW